MSGAHGYQPANTILQNRKNENIYLIPLEKVQKIPMHKQFCLVNGRFAYAVSQNYLIREITKIKLKLTALKRSYPKCFQKKKYSKHNVQYDILVTYDIE